jgi:hypothetical protein
MIQDVIIRLGRFGGQIRPMVASVDSGDPSSPNTVPCAPRAWSIPTTQRALRPAVEGAGRDVWGDQALSRYPVLKIHATAAMHTIKNAIIMTRLTPALISEVS